MDRKKTSEDELVGDIETPRTVVIPSPAVTPSPSVVSDAGSPQTREVPEREEDNQLSSAVWEWLIKGAEALRIGDGVRGTVGGDNRGAVGGGARAVFEGETPGMFGDGPRGAVGGGNLNAFGVVGEDAGVFGGETRVVVGGLEETKNPESGGQLIASAQEEDGILTVTVKLPDYLSSKRVSLLNKIDCVRTWTGEKTSTLKVPLQKILEMEEDTAVLLASAIRKEQNLEMEYQVFQEEIGEGLTWYTYMMEVFPSEEKGEESSGVKQPPGLYFTESGEGFSAHEAEIEAAKKLLILIRSMMHSTG